MCVWAHHDVALIIVSLVAMAQTTSQAYETITPMVCELHYGFSAINFTVIKHYRLIVNIYVALYGSYSQSIRAKWMLNLKFS